MGVARGAQAGRGDGRRNGEKRLGEHGTDRFARGHACPFCRRQPAPVHKVGAALDCVPRTGHRRRSSSTRASTTTVSSRRSSSRSSACPRRRTASTRAAARTPQQTARMLPGIEDAVLAEEPDAVVVLGDTNSTLAGALAAAKLQRPGRARRGRPALLRPDDARGAEPESLVDRSRRSSSSRARSPSTNLRREGIVEGVREVGDVMQDANLRLAPLARERSTALADAGVEPGALPRPDAPPRGERRRPSRSRDVVEALRRIDEPVVFPAHPRTRPRSTAAGLELPANVRRAPARRLPRLRGARLAGARDPHRLGRDPEGGVLVRGAVRHAPREHGVDRDGAAPAGTCSSGRTPRGSSPRSRAAAPGPEHPPLYGDGRAAEKVADLLCSLRRR